MDFLKTKIDEQSQGFYMVTLDGPMDTNTYEQFNADMDHILRPPIKKIVLDMTNVTYISSMGVGSLFKITKFAKQNNVEFMILGIQPQVKKVLDAVKALPAQKVFKDLQEMDDYLDMIQKSQDNKG